MPAEARLPASFLHVRLPKDLFPKRGPVGLVAAYDQDMEFRILGPLQVRDRDRELPLGGPAERHLLAVLLCLANQPVRTQRLIDELWEDDPPASARNIVQQYVSRLRQALGDESRLTTEPGGYVLHVEDGELDWQQFRDLTQRASQAKNRSHAAALLREALSLWEGPALSGAGDGPTVTADRMQLEEGRLHAIEDRVDYDLELGNHCEVTAELESLVEQYPQRERFLGQLMVALYRCDRQREALRCFEDYRRRLAEESGLDPGASLSDLESRILADDPSISAPHSTDQEQQTNVPQRLSSFIGREQELADVTARISEHRLVTLVGVGGIGKTSLGLRAVADLHDAFPDGIWMIDLAPLSDSDLIAGAAAGVLGASLDPRTGAVDAVVDHLRDHVALIVLDNCEHLIDGAAQFALRVLQHAPDVGILATSREPLGVTGEALVRVPPLSLPADGDIAASEAVQLFVERARLLDRGFSIDETNSTQVAAICRQLDGIPLAIELAAARLSTMTLDQIADGIDDRYALLTRGARSAPERHKTLRAMVDWSHDVLTEEEQIVFRRLGAFAGTFTAAGAEHVCGYAPLTPNDVGPRLDQLVDASLVDPPEPSSDRFRMLETIRDYARKHLDKNEETDETMRRLAGYLNEHGPASEEGYPVSDYEAWYHWRDAERDNFRSVLAWALATPDPDVAATTAIEFRNYLAIGNLAHETTRLVDSVLELLGDEMSHRHLRLFSFAVVNEAFLGDHSRARSMAKSLYERARILGKEEGVMGFALQLMAMDELRSGNVEGALELNEQCISHLRAANDLRAPDQMWVRSFFLTRVGRFEEARAVLEGMLELAQQMGERYDNRFAEASLNIGTAIVACYEGNGPEAEQLLDREHEYIRSLGPDDMLAYTWGRWQAALLRDDAAGAERAARELADVTPESAGSDRRRDVAYMCALPALALRGPVAARPYLLEAVRQAHVDNATIDSAEIATVVAESALLTGECAVAAVLYAAASRILDPSSIVVSPWQRNRIDESIEAVRTSLDSSRFEDLWNRGAAMTPDEMVRYAADYLGLDLPEIVSASQ
ncbi:MAG: BTAD domain-containing putative transcriptional regulator [Acidimicrobiia bacterium]|nr:BTAD domain-containing putative transcriptional regulator [Acidimicrobiia bacterium]